MPLIQKSDPGIGFLDNRYVNVTGDTMTGALTISLATGNALIVNTTDFVVDATNDRIGIGISDPGYAIDFIGGNSTPAGVIRTSSVITDATTKQGGFVIRHYTNSEESVPIYAANIISTANQIFFGGGHPNLNAATEIRFYTAANTTTLTGTQRMTLDTDGQLGIAVAAPLARLHITEATIGNEIFRLTSTATNDDPTVNFYQNRVATTDATVTTIHTVAISVSNSAMLIKVFVTARRTGGTGGTNGDSAAYEMMGLFKNIAGVVSQVGTTDQSAKEDQAAWDVTFNISGTNVQIQVTGAVNNNITWHALIITQTLSS